MRNLWCEKRIFFLMNNKWILISHETFCKQQKYVYLSGLISNQDIRCKYVKFFSSPSFFKFLHHLAAAKREEKKRNTVVRICFFRLMDFNKKYEKTEKKEENCRNKKLNIKKFNKTTCINLTFMLPEFVFIWEFNSTC